MNPLRTILTALAASFALALAAEGPEIFWRETFHDFGVFNEDDGLARTSFRYINTGSELLIIIKVRTTCGCTVADYSRRPLAPGDSAEIIVDYDPSGRLGRFEKGIIVDTNTEPRRSHLKIKGTVVGGEESVRAQYPVAHGPLAIRKATALVGDVLKGHMKTVFINAYNRSNDSIAPRIGKTPDWIHISLEPSRIAPGEQASFIVYFRSDRCPDWGLSESFIDIAPDAALDPFTLPVVASVVEDFSSLSDKDIARAPVLSFDPERVVLPPVAPEAGEAVTASFRITNRGRSPLEIRRIWSPDPAIRILSTPKKALKPGKHVDIPFSVNPAEISGDIINSRITIITNDPTNSVASIRVVAETIP